MFGTPLYPTYQTFLALGIAALICLATMNVSGLLLCGSLSAIMAQGARIAARRDREGR